MKKLLVAWFFSLALAITAMAEVPPVGQSLSTASVPLQTQRQFQKLDSTFSGGTITVTTFLGPTMTSPSWVEYASKLIADAMGNNLDLSQKDITSPKQYLYCNGRIEWYNFVYSTSAPLWTYQLYPLPPFDNEKGQEVMQLVHGKAAFGDTISLAGTEVSSQSSDPDNVLGDQLTFGLLNYGILAVGRKADGSLVTSGPSSQMVNEVFFITMMKTFNIGGSQQGLDMVENWVKNQGNFTVTYSAQFVGHPETKMTTSVSLYGYRNIPPTLTIDASGVHVSGELGRYYTIQAAPTVNGPWQAVGTVHSSGTLPVAFEGKSAFFRASAW